MELTFQNTAGNGWRAHCMLIFSLEGANIESYAAETLKQAPWLGISPARADATGAKDEMTIAYGHPELELSRAMLCGLGKEDKLNMNGFRLAVAAAVQQGQKRKYAKLGIPVETLAPIAACLKVSVETLIKEAVIAAKLALYSFDMCKSNKTEKKAPIIPELSLLFSLAETPDAARLAARAGEAEANGVLFARTLSNTPANLLTPSKLAEKAQELAARASFSCTVLDETAIQELGMGALWAVAQGSVQPPRCIILEHCPKGKEQTKPLIFVGKGITFDTGGISLKPSANMHEMKGDMGGAAAILGFFTAISELEEAPELPRIIGIIPTAENMPGGHATRPGDIVTTLSGQTVEILNTDAEGRLILCDALSYAQEHWEAEAIIDVATLTGACVIALGDLATGVFSKDRQLRSLVLDAADNVGDLCWPLPLWDEYDENLQSDVADIPNIGPREGGALHAALFLQRFINKGQRWLHLDIAGPGYVTKKTALHPVAGGTGVGVRLFCEFARQFGK